MTDFVVTWIEVRAVQRPQTWREAEFCIQEKSRVLCACGTVLQKDGQLAWQLT